jgi:hypothetical protein
MTQTHVNAYRQDVDDAYLKVQQALSAYKDAVDALVARLDEDKVEAEPTPADYPEVVPQNGPVGPGTNDTQLERDVPQHDAKEADKDKK